MPIILKLLAYFDIRKPDNLNRIKICSSYRVWFLLYLSPKGPNIGDPNAKQSAYIVTPYAVSPTDVLKLVAISGNIGKMIKESAPVTKTPKNNPKIIIPLLFLLIKFILFHLLLL